MDRLAQDSPAIPAPLTGFTPQALELAFVGAGINPVHAVKILRHFHRFNGLPDWDKLSVSQVARNWLDANHRKSPVATHSEVVARDGTTKLLMTFPDRQSVECVHMPGHRPGLSAGCVSSQVGCAMGCDFCASTRNGMARNLTTGEIVEQVHNLKRIATQSGRKLRTLVFMGMGEPLLNFDAVTTAIQIIGDPAIDGLGWRQITVSTVGIVPGIDRLAERDLGVHLALSLHAPDDGTRSRLVPGNRRYPVAEILTAARRFHERTGRIVNIEYCLLKGVNDSPAQASLLADLLDGFRAHVNIIPYNPIGVGISGITYHRPPPHRTADFVDQLRARRVVTHIRETRGEDANAACGQLRLNVASA